jgi:hypothetical protein
MILFTLLFKCVTILNFTFVYNPSCTKSQNLYTVLKYPRFEVFTVVNIHVKVFCVVMPYSVVVGSYHNTIWHHNPEDLGLNTWNYLKSYAKEFKTQLNNLKKKRHLSSIVCKPFWFEKISICMRSVGLLLLRILI